MNWVTCNRNFLVFFRTLLSGTSGGVLTWMCTQFEPYTISWGRGQYNSNVRVYISRDGADRRGGEGTASATVYGTERLLAPMDWVSPRARKTVLRNVSK